MSKNNLIRITSWLHPEDEIVLKDETISNLEWMKRELIKFQRDSLSYKLEFEDGKIAIFREKKYKKRGKND